MWVQLLSILGSLLSVLMSWVGRLQSRGRTAEMDPDGKLYYPGDPPERPSALPNRFTPEVEAQIRSMREAELLPSNLSGYQPRQGLMGRRPPDTQSGVFATTVDLSRSPEVAAEIRAHPERGSQIVADYLAESTSPKKYKVVNNKFIEEPKSRLESLIIDGE